MYLLTCEGANNKHKIESSSSSNSKGQLSKLNNSVDKKKNKWMKVRLRECA